MEPGNVIMSNAIPTRDKVDVAKESQVLCGYIPKTKVLKTTLKGNYTNLPKAWEETMVYLAKNNLSQSNNVRKHNNALNFKTEARRPKYRTWNSKQLLLCSAQLSSAQLSSAQLT